MNNMDNIELRLWLVRDLLDWGRDTRRSAAAVRCCVEADGG